MDTFFCSQKFDLKKFLLNVLTALAYMVYLCKKICKNIATEW